MGSDAVQHSTIYLDNAATSHPKPDSVVRAIVSYLTEIGGNPGRGSHASSEAATKLLWSARDEVCAFLGIADAYRFIFTPNATYALNFALLGFLRDGDRVLVDRAAHNSVLRPVTWLAAARGVAVHYFGGGPPSRALEEARSALRGGFRLAVVSHASNVTGLVMPLGEFCAEAAEQDVPVLVDAAQTAGKYPLAARTLPGLAFLVVSGHKALLGPPGVGGLYVAPGFEIEPTIRGGTGSRSESLEQPRWLPDLLEPGTPNLVGIAGLRAGIEFLLEEGIDGIRSRDRVLTSKLIESIEGLPGIVGYGFEPGVERVGTVAFNLEGRDPREVAHVLERSHGILCRAGLHCAPLEHRALGTFPAGCVRVSLGAFSLEKDVVQLIEGLSRICIGTGSL